MTRRERHAAIVERFDASTRMRLLNRLLVRLGPDALTDEALRELAVLHIRTRAEHRRNRRHARQEARHVS